MEREEVFEKWREGVSLIGECTFENSRRIPRIIYSWGSGGREPQDHLSSGV